MHSMRGGSPARKLRKKRRRLVNASEHCYGKKERSTEGETGEKNREKKTKQSDAVSVGVPSLSEFLLRGGYGKCRWCRNHSINHIPFLAPPWVVKLIIAVKPTLQKIEKQIATTAKE